MSVMQRGAIIAPKNVLDRLKRVLPKAFKVISWGNPNNYPSTKAVRSMFEGMGYTSVSVPNNKGDFVLLAYRSDEDREACYKVLKES